MGHLGLDFGFVMVSVALMIVGSARVRDSVGSAQLEPAVVVRRSTNVEEATRMAPSLHLCLAPRAG